MSQQIFPLMFALDWLSLTILCDNETPGISNAELFDVTLREYGTKQFKQFYDIQYINLDGVLEPFGSFMCEPTSTTWKSNLCSLKLANKMLYNDGAASWLAAVNIFCETYNLRIANVTRADLACDFLFLRNRISGPALVKRLKNHTWWKCGSVNCSEHFVMPYSIKWEKSFGEDIYETDIYMQGGEFTAMTETLTFGTMSSDAQVCIYDKTRELNRNAVTIQDADGKDIRVSHKEYIRDCHKMAGVWDETRHTWRIEIRLRKDAAFILDPQTTTYRPLLIEDLAPERLADTYRAAADKYFRVVDPTLGGTRQITAELCASLRGHKNRMPQIHLFAGASSVKMSRRRYTPPSTSYNRAVIRRLEELGDRLERVPIKTTKPEDLETLTKAIDLMDGASQRQDIAHANLLGAKTALLKAYKVLTTDQAHLTPEQHRIIIQAKEVLERHLSTESPTFTRNMISSLSHLSNVMPLSGGTQTKCRIPPEVLPGDAKVLEEAAAILKGIYVSACAEDRRATDKSLYIDAVQKMFTRLSDPEGIVTHADFLAAQYIFLDPHGPLTKPVIDKLLTDTYGLAQIPGRYILQQSLMIYKRENL